MAFMLMTSFFYAFGALFVARAAAGRGNSRLPDIEHGTAVIRKVNLAGPFAASWYFSAIAAIGCCPGRGE
jgi:hypothetical protein